MTNIIIGGFIAVTLGNLVSDLIVGFAIKWSYKRKSKDLAARLEAMKAVLKDKDA